MKIFPFLTAHVFTVRHSILIFVFLIHCFMMFSNVVFVGVNLVMGYKKKIDLIQIFVNSM